MENFIKIPKPEFEVGQTVYLITDVEQLPRIVTEWIYKSATKQIEYCISSGIVSSYHYDFEISNTKMFNF